MAQHRDSRSEKLDSVAMAPRKFRKIEDSCTYRQRGVRTRLAGSKQTQYFPSPHATRFALQPARPFFLGGLQLYEGLSGYPSSPFVLVISSDYVLASDLKVSPENIEVIVYLVSTRRRRHVQI
ncbi:hypothetical protein PMIN01_09264 [Paraphaeosphaeria minitans]|uniref:Uncharacterized protein n=1 Tax=Paraphaeosphaeria minitans TaxID=565426 RepID=A0A9P6GBZ2_9PLEO|nr:hypothetical protein PMIN01_09264 [Paraphaeosphaeria minitans]